MHHVWPPVIADDLHAGKTIRQGQVVATVRDPSKPSSRILPHLHISVGWVNPFLPFNRLDWNIIGAREAVTLVDPLNVLKGPYRIEDRTLSDPQHPTCSPQPTPACRHQAFF